jgi:hypothetical protein
VHRPTAALDRPAGFNNLFDQDAPSAIDFRAHAESLGARAEEAANIRELEDALGRARHSDRTSVIVIDTDPRPRRRPAGAGGMWPCRKFRNAERSARRAGNTRRRWGERRERAHRRKSIGWSNDDLRELGGATPLETCLSEARAAGFEGMELGHKFPRSPTPCGPRSRASGSPWSPVGTRLRS